MKRGEMIVKNPAVGDTELLLQTGFPREGVVSIFPKASEKIMAFNMDSMLGSACGTTAPQP